MLSVLGKGDHPFSCAAVKLELDCVQKRALRLVESSVANELCARTCRPKQELARD